MIKKQKADILETKVFHNNILGKNTLRDIYIPKHSAINSVAGTFYHYTSPEELLGILRNKQIFFTDCHFLNDYRERLEINEELELFWSKNKEKYEKDFYNLISGI
jgi:hypothetical protein